MNIVAFFHAYKFTHFTSDIVTKTKDAKQLSTVEKIKTLFFGINNPRPTNHSTPSQKFRTIKLKSNKEIECWSIKTEKPKGTVILFHGYSGEKSSMIDKSDEFLKMGYNTLLVDFMGAGGSEGNQTTAGFKEAEEVKTCYDYLSNAGEQKIYLYGTSMGAVAILKAIKDYQIKPSAIIIECPFGTMYQTTCARFKSLGVPSFPMAGLLVFWGGIQNGFWAFSHQPTEYAKSIKCPTLMLYGEKDEKVSRKEIDEIFANLNCKKELKTYPLAGHENYLIKYKQK
ncbi:MAG: alpha/beta hydrolase, partial [Bacteroidetes bacterium]|nr:alpha/beta hydrolase [Bacteroidota bacterium]